MSKPDPTSFEGSAPDEAAFAAPVPDNTSFDDAFSHMQSEAPKREGHLGPAFVAGLVVAVLCATVWAAITIITEFQIGWIAIAVGALVGLSVRKVGKGTESVFGVIGAGLAVFGCLLGDFMTTVYMVADHFDISPLSVFFSADSALLNVFIESMDPITLIFYAIAAYEGYRFSFTRLDDV